MWKTGEAKGNTTQERGGRNPDWLKKKCALIVDRNKLIEFLGDVASGKYKDKVPYVRPVRVEIRLKAIEMLLDRGFGKPSQDVGVSGEIGGKLIIVRSNEKS